MYTLQDAAKTIGIQVRTIREWKKLGKINAVKTGYRYYVTDEEVMRLKENRKLGKDENEN